MRFVGRPDIVRYSTQYPEQAGRLSAWVAEIEYNRWESAPALLAHFPNADAESAPIVVFRFQKLDAVIETAIDFKAGVVLVANIHCEPLVHPSFERTLNRGH